MGVKDIFIGGNKLIIHELEDVYDSRTGRTLTGSWVWNSALILAEWMSTQVQLNDFDFTDKIVLELGAGTGLPGLTAALLGAKKVILTDIEPLILGLEKNVEANEVKDRVEVSQLVWGSKEVGGLGKVDVVLMSDVFLDVEDMPAMAETLKRVCGKETRIWGASEVRPWTYACLNELASQGFGVVELMNRFGEMTDSVSDVFSVIQLIPPVHVEDIGHSIPEESSDEANKE